MVLGPGAAMSIVEDLKHRQLVQWGLAYLAGGWFVVQLMDALDGPLGLSLGFRRIVLFLVVAGFPLALTLAWYHGEKGRQRASGPELLIIAALLGISALLVRVVISPSAPNVPGAEIGDGSPRLAVLLFDNRSQRAEDADFTHGIQDQILTELSKRSDLTVLSRTSVLEYGDAPKNTRQIAAELGATHIVEGAVQRSSDSVLVTVQLINAASDSHVWAADYQRELSAAGLFGIQREVAGRIARELSLQLAPPDPRQADGLPTESLAAWEAYSQAKLIEGLSSLSLQKKAELADRAVELDPTFAEAWAELATARATYAALVRDSESFRLSKQALRQAQRLDPDNLDVLAAEGIVTYYVGRDYPRAVALLEEVERNRPNSPESIMIRARILSRLGEYSKAIEGYERALAVDPRSPRILNLLAHLTRQTGRFDVGLRYTQRWRLVAGPDEMVHASDEVALFPLIERGDTAEFRRQRESFGLEVDRVQCGGLGWLPYLRRQFDLALRLCRESNAGRVQGSVVRWMQVAVLADWVDRPSVSRIYADSLRTGVEAYFDELDQAAYGEYRWPLAWAWTQRAIAHALVGEREETLRAGRKAFEVFTPKDDVQDTGRLAAILVDAYTQIGDYEEALDMLEIAARAPIDLYAPVLRLDRKYDPLRDFPRFQEILRRLEEPAPDVAR
jgi:TolB-like protein